MDVQLLIHDLVFLRTLRSFPWRVVFCGGLILFEKGTTDRLASCGLCLEVQLRVFDVIPSFISNTVLADVSCEFYDM